MLFTERLIGRLVANARVADVNDKQVVNFTLAINDRYKTKEGELKESVTFIDCAIWNRPNVAEYPHQRRNRKTERSPQSHGIRLRSHI